MAFLIPKNIPTRSGVPNRLRQVARSLRDFMPDEATVWLRNTGREEPPYLLVLDPSAGIALMETPVIRQSQSKRTWFGKGRPADQQKLLIRKDVADLARNLESKIDPNRIPSLPVRHVVALPGHDEPPPEVEGLGNGVDLLLRPDLADQGLPLAMRRIFGLRREGSLNDREQQLVRAAINPRVVINLKLEGSEAEQAVKIPLFHEPEIAPEDIIRVMDRKQERLAEHMGWGYRMLRGVAGSGKTLVLTHRARFLRERFPNYRILVLCYNRVLANGLRGMIGKSNGTKVIHIDSLAFELAGKKPSGNTFPDFPRLRLKAIEAAERLPDSRRYDVVLVDEAQDFDHGGLGLAYHMLKKNRRNLSASQQDLTSAGAGHLVLALDSAQNLYQRRSMTWNPPNITAQGRTEIFRSNYRNTRQILDLAWKFLAGKDFGTSKRANAEDEGALIPPEAGYRDGPPPKVLACGDLRGEARTIAREVNRLLKEGVQIGDIAILYGTRDLQEKLYHELARRQGLPYFHIQHKDKKEPQDRRDTALQKNYHLRVSTIQGIKGLEFSRVLIGGVNQARAHDIPEEEQVEAVKRLVYVGMTRAMDELVITYSGSGAIGQALTEAST